ncbi:MAG: S8 family serine peptidase [Saprospiraceae bacterium]|jgi:hypothetical protein|nr:S8 family serine peptidase [Saprospiraceae bacterium]
MNRNFLPGFLLASLLFCLAFSLHAQSPWKAKCAPSLLIQSRSTEPERFVVVADDLPALERRLAVEQPGIAVLHTYAPAGIAVLWCTRAVLFEKILPLPEVLFADLGHATGREERAVPGHNLFANTIRYVHARQPTLDGSGATISIKEFRFDSTDDDLKGRVLLTGKSATGQTVHAGLMATLAGGAGNTDPEARGVARGSRLMSSSFVGLLPDADADYAGFDISVQNHSYGLDIENYYGAGALAYDAATQQHPELLHVFSAGNQGADTAVGGVYAGIAGFANLTGNFKMAKNVLTVGATDSFGAVFPFSSHGPAYDGRIKPDVAAFGQNGSSESAALVSGTAAVVQQAFFEKNGYQPSSDMLRAVLIGSCDDTGVPGPDFVGGFGNVNLKKAVELVQMQATATGAMVQDGSAVFQVTLPLNAYRLRATLCWNDMPAAPNAAKALVNDLDLTVAAPDATVWHPWVLNPAPHPDSLRLPAVRARDSLNTVEQVTIEQPAPGVYEIQVRGYAVPTGNQSFALALHWDTLQHFDWTCPLYNAPATAGTEAILRWETTFPDARGVLDWKPVGAADWRSIDPEALLAPGFRRWFVPDTLAAVQVRMTVAGKNFLSDTFLISPEHRVRVRVNCPDSLLLSWTAPVSAVAWRVWGLGDRYLEPLLVTTDTAVVLQKSAYPQQRFAVSVLDENALAESLTKSTPDLQQTTGCYIVNLLAFLDEQENAVDLTLDLGSLYGVRRIFIEKQRDGVWETLHTGDPVSLQVLHTDEAPVAGTNIYRARLEMENGGEIVGTPVVVYFAGPSGYLVLPNPAESGGSIAVLAKFTVEVPRFFLYDALGRLMLEQELAGGRTLLPLPTLPPGCYFWVVAGEETGNWLGSGRVFVGR